MKTSISLRHRFMVGLALSWMALIGFERASDGTTPPGDGPYSNQDVKSEPIYFYLRNVNPEKESPEALLQDYMERHTTQKYVTAVEMAIRLIERIPDQPIGYYNLACSQAKLHRYDKALEALEMAIDRGWRNLEHTRSDPDLTSIRQNPRYHRLLAKINRIRERERIVTTEIRRDEWSEVVEDLRLQTPSLLDRYHIPGVTLAYVHEGEFVWCEAFGVNDIEKHERMAIDHGFKLGAPAHLFALMAALREESLGTMSVVDLLKAGAEFDRDDPSTLAREIDRRPRAYVFGISRQPGRSDSPPARNVSYTDPIVPIAPVGWPSYTPGLTSFVLLQLAIEEQSEGSFYDYCREHIFKAMQLDATDFVHRDAIGEKPAVGHTMLGTPIASAVDKSWRTPAVITTAPDMGRLLAELLNTEKATARNGSTMPPLHRTLGPIASQLDDLGFALHIKRTKSGPCIQLADSRGGQGCLVQWYPGVGSGIVVMFNSENGPEAALRIAQIALGG